MKPITYTECKKLTESVYNRIGANTGKNAIDVTLMIVAHESGRGEHRRQIGADDPALGLGQMERATFNDTLKHSDRINSYLLRGGYCPKSVEFEQIEEDDELALIFIRARLAMDINPLPSGVIHQAVYCKEYWNAGGKATPDKYLIDYIEWSRVTD